MSVVVSRSVGLDANHQGLESAAVLSRQVIGDVWLVTLGEALPLVRLSGNYARRLSRPGS